MKQAQRVMFESEPVWKASAKLALPSIAGQIVLVIYNMADTFFVGLTDSDAMITAVTVCLPAFMFLSAISNLFGIGAGAAYSRAQGKTDRQRADNTVTHALYGCIAVTALYMILAFLFRDVFLNMLGGKDPAVHEAAVSYLLVTVCLGGMAASLGTMFSHLIRAEGKSGYAAAGVIAGGILNIVLDPLFMFVLLPKGSEVLGAALATALSNSVSFLWFIWLLKKKSSLRFRYGEDAFSDGSMREVLLTGLPACLMTLFENISYAVLDGLMAGYGIAAQAGLGVAKKINMLAHSIVRGLAQGVLPLLAYNYAAKNFTRMKQAVRISMSAAAGISALLAVIYFFMSRELAGVFISNGGPSLEYGSVFLKILCLGCPFSGFAYMVISFFQAVNKSRRSFGLAILRKGIVDIPLMYILEAVSGICGLVAATPAADIICCAAAAVLLGRWLRTHHGDSSLKKGEQEATYA